MNSECRFNKTTGSHVGKNDYRDYTYWSNGWRGWGMRTEWELQEMGMLCKECYTTKLAIETKIRQ